MQMISVRKPKPRASLRNLSSRLSASSHLSRPSEVLYRAGQNPFTSRLLLCELINTAKASTQEKTTTISSAWSCCDEKFLQASLVCVELRSWRKAWGRNDQPSARDRLSFRNLYRYCRRSHIIKSFTECSVWVAEGIKSCPRLRKHVTKIVSQRVWDEPLV